MGKPLVAVVDWLQSPRGDMYCYIEKRDIGSAGTVEYFLCDKPDSWNDRIFDADVIMIWHNVDMPAEVIRKLRRCRAIIRNGTGYDTVDIVAARECGIDVCNVPNYGTDEVADHTIALTLALCRQIIPIDKLCKNLGWEFPKQNIRRIKELNFGIIGLGRIGTSVALKAKALGFMVTFYDPYVSSGIDKSLSITRFKSFDAMLDHMDVVSINCPLTPETHHMFTEKQFNQMMPTSFIVNTARGAIIKKDDLFAALRSGSIAGAALDVIEDEPLKTVEEANTPNLIATCHSAFYSDDAAVEMREFASEIAKCVVTGKKVENIVN